MRTWIKVTIWIVILGVLSFVAYIAFLIFRPSTDVLVDSVEYHSKEELTDLFGQNEELLNRVKDSFISNKKLLHALIDEKDGDVGIYLKQDEEYFSQEEWQDILAVFEDFHPIMLMLERKGRPLIFYITFASQKQNNITKSTYLYWFPNDDERAYHEEDGVFPDGVFTQIDGGWYIVETTDTR